MTPLLQYWMTWTMYFVADDIDDDEELRELSRVSCHSSSLPPTTSDSQPMDQHTAIVRF